MYKSRIFSIVLLIAFTTLNINVVAQNIDSLTLSLEESYQKIDSLSHAGHFEKAIELGEGLIEKTDKAGKNLLRADTHLLLAKCHIVINNQRQAIFNLHYATLLYEKEKSDKLIKCYRLLADEHAKSGSYNLSTEYYKNEIKLLESTEDTASIIYATANIANAYYQLDQYEFALDYYNDLLDLLENAENSFQGHVYYTLSILNDHGRNSELSKKYSKKARAVFIKNSDWNKTVKINNNVGYFHFQQEQYDSAHHYFREALNFSQLAGPTLAKELIVSTYFHYASSLVKLGKRPEALDMYYKGLQIAEKNQLEKEKARGYNYISTLYIQQNYLYKASKALEKAILIGENNQFYEVLTDSYHIQALINKARGDYKNSQIAESNFSKYQFLIDEKQKDENELLQKQVKDLERIDQDIRLLVSRTEQQKLSLKKLQLEAEQQKQALLVLEQQKRLNDSNLKMQEAEKRRVANELALTQEKLLAEQKQKELEILQSQKALQDLQLKQKEDEEREKEKTIQLLEVKQKLQQEQLAKDNMTKKISALVIMIIAIFLVFVIYFFIKSRRSNRLLKKQQLEIQDMNEELITSEEELKQNFEELQATQETLQKQSKNIAIQKDILAKQNKKLDDKVHQVTKSIQYAETIQNAILPSQDTINEMFPDNFVLYKAKDIVSGDFYWFSEHETSRIVSVIDCTGHGVPGAFISLLGNNILSEIILQKEILDPAEILTELNKKIRLRLHQEKGQNDDGMDMILSLISPTDDPKIFRMSYSGAKGKIFIVQNGGVRDLKGDNHSIGGIVQRREPKFTNKDIFIHKGDCIYLASDGFIDQSDPKRKKFSSIKFKNLIEKAQHLPMDAQKDIFIKALADHQQGSAQRDDITVIGIRV